MTKVLNVSIEKVENRLLKVEKQVKVLVDGTQKRCENELELAEVLVNKELRSKIIMSQWTNKFLSETNTVYLDPITFALTRFCLNVCLSFNEVHPSYLIETSIHKQLIAYASLPNELVKGPALMGLVHISLYRELKPEIVISGALQMILKHMIESKSFAILNQCCKLCASLALHHSNKSLMASSGCLHAIFDLVLGTNKEVDKYIQYGALCTVVNVVNESNSNRMLSVELNGIRPVLTLLRTTTHEDLMIQCVKAIANIAYCSGYCANRVLIAGGGEALVEVLESNDILQQSTLAQLSLAALANICNNETNQSHIGSTEGLIECVIRICEHGRDHALVEEAANFILSCCWQNTINKARIANKNGCRTLMKRIIHHSSLSGSNNERFMEKLCWALSSVLLYPPNHEKIFVINGLEDLIKLCKKISDPLILRLFAQVITTMVPDADELLRYHEDDTKHITEKCNALQILKKAKFLGFGNDLNPPVWLEKAIRLLSLTDVELKVEREIIWMKNEFVDKLVYCEEFITNVLPDTTVMETKDFRGLLFSIY